MLQFSSSAVTLAILSFPVKGIKSLFTHFPNDTERGKAPISPLIWGGNMLSGKKRNLFLQLFEVLKRFQMLEGKGGSVGRVERRCSKVEIKALHHIILKFIILIISPHCSYQLQCN